MNLNNFKQLYHSLTFRLVLIYMLMFSVSAVLLLVVVSWLTDYHISQQVDDEIAAELSWLESYYQVTGLSRFSEKLAMRGSGGLTRSVYILADASRQPVTGNLGMWPTSTGGKQAKKKWIEFDLRDQNRLSKVTHRIRAAWTQFADGHYLLVGRDLFVREQARLGGVKSMSWGLRLIVLLALVGGFIISRLMLRRLDAINQVSREIMTSGDLSRRIPTYNSGDEFDELSDNLNQMLNRIESSMEDVQRVSDNIAHDLRTPLARLKNRLEQLRLAPETEEQRIQTVDRAIEDTDGLLMTFNSLLRIARVEAGRQRKQFSPVDMKILIQDVVELYEPLIEEKQQHLNLQLSRGIAFSGDRNLLFQALANLLDNAIKYTAETGTIDLVLDPQADGFCFTLADNGPGIPDQAREKVFQRFYRLESSRSTQGNGLGLSLVAAVMKLHDLQLTLKDSNPGLRIVIEQQSQSSDRT